MDDFEEREIETETVSNDGEQPAAEERNTNAPSGWSYSANTNKYVSYDGSADPNTGSWNPGEGQSYTAENNARVNENPHREYGTQYGYYNNAGQTPNYYSNSGANPYENGYNWDFNKYESAGNGNAVSKKSGSGFKIFLIIIAVLFGCCIIALASYGVYNMIKGTGSENIIGNYFPGIENKTETPEENETPKFELEEIPESEDTVTTDGAMNAKEVYKFVSPCVVGVVNYQYSTSFGPVSSGSGIIISADGYILTNAHVVRAAEAVKVVLYNNDEYEAEVIGADDQTDVAVLKIEATNLTPATLGDSDMMEVGDTVYALGNPGGLTLQSSFTNGIISGLNRVITTQDSIYSMTVLQTNAAISHGSSGGALINEFGQVIGITSAGLAASDYENVGFAIPTSTAIPIAEDIIANGYVSGRAKLGITGRVIDSITSRYYGVPVGIQITEIEKNGSFYKTVVEVGDIITSFDGKAIESMSDLQTALAEHKPGDTVEIELYRYGAKASNSKAFSVSVKLVENKG